MPVDSDNSRYTTDSSGSERYIAGTLTTVPSRNIAHEQPGVRQLQTLSASGSLPDVGGFFGLEMANRAGLRIKRLLYRVALLAATAVLVYAIVWLQSKVGQSFADYNSAQRIIQWAELIWLTPVPLSIVLWLGWVIFAEPKLPAFVDVPFLHVETEGGSTSTATRPARLVFRFVTRGDNVDVLRQSVASVRNAFAAYPLSAGPYRIEVVTEQEVDVGPDVNVIVVPPTFQTPERSRYKARALTYLQSHADVRPEDWYLYLDEESGVSAYLIAGVYEFIKQAHKKTNTPRIIGQGAILYQGGTWFFRGADALRAADDFGRFRVQYAVGMPLFGIHGSFIVTPARSNNELSFDVGYDNSITEDAAWALRAWAKGWRFGWVRGCVHEQPPQRTWDFIKQRARWLSGIRLVLTDRTVPVRYRACLGVFTALWQLSFLPFVVAAAGLIYHVLPFSWMRIPADFAWAVFVLAYVLGADVQAKYSQLKSDGTFHRRNRLQRIGARVFGWAMAVNYIWFALLEAISIVYSLKPGQGFFVIKKPSLTNTEAPVDAAPLTTTPTTPTTEPLPVPAYAASTFSETIGE